MLTIYAALLLRYYPVGPWSCVGPDITGRRVTKHVHVYTVSNAPATRPMMRFVHPVSLWFLHVVSLLIEPWSGLHVVLSAASVENGCRHVYQITATLVSQIQCKAALRHLHVGARPKHSKTGRKTLRNILRIIQFASNYHRWSIGHGAMDCKESARGLEPMRRTNAPGLFCA